MLRIAYAASRRPVMRTNSSDHGSLVWSITRTDHRSEWSTHTVRYAVPSIFMRALYQVYLAPRALPAWSCHARLGSVVADEPVLSVVVQQLEQALRDRLPRDPAV